MRACCRSTYNQTEPDGRAMRSSAFGLNSVAVQLPAHWNHRNLSQTGNFSLGNPSLRNGTMGSKRVYVKNVRPGHCYLSPYSHTYQNLSRACQALRPPFFRWPRNDTLS